MAALPRSSRDRMGLKSNLRSSRSGPPLQTPPRLQREPTDRSNRHDHERSHGLHHTCLPSVAERDRLRSCAAEGSRHVGFGAAARHQAARPVLLIEMARPKPLRSGGKYNGSWAGLPTSPFPYIAHKGVQEQIMGYRDSHGVLGATSRQEMLDLLPSGVPADKVFAIASRRSMSGQGAPWRSAPQMPPT